MPKVGRPLSFNNKEELQKKIDEYFTYCDNRIKSVFIPKLGDHVTLSEPAPYTMSGLARWLGIDRRTLVNYSHKEEFFPTIREARQKVEEDVETRMMETKNEKGAKFSLTNNFGWIEKSQTDLTTGGDKIEFPAIFIPKEE